MTEVEFFEITEAMLRYGGSFVQALALAMRAADWRNRQVLIAAFPQYCQQYAAFARRDRGDTDSHVG